MSVSIVVTLLGGLGLFLMGMHQMSDGMAKAAGARMRGILEAATSNRIKGTLVGIVFCALIQSSSATTVMVVSFVNAGMMTLYQAAGVIFGANIGTTITSQLVSFNLSEYAPLILFAGVIMTQFIKDSRVKKVGEVILGFGVLFMGLDLMSGSMSSLKDSPQIAQILGGLTNPVLAVLVGTVITAIIQSSSVTVSIILLMAQQGLLELPICFY
ncbi:MAG: Na/Pi symporter, partial [Lachnospiraceae bacterium]|nr:Na/Pi symporter [Lachnospiraceae bacterium]